MASPANPLIPYDYDYYGAPQLPQTPRNPVPYQHEWGIQDATIHGRQRAAGAEDMYAQRWRDLDYPYYQQEQRYRQLGDQAYEPIFRGQGGYSPQEQESLRLSPQEQQSMHLQDWERAGIQGNPEEAFRYYNPGLLWGNVGETEARMREGLNDGGMGIRGAYGYGEAGEQAELARLRGGLDVAIDPNRLRLSEGFGEDYPLSDQEIQQMAELSGRAAGMRYQSSYDDIARRAAASGTTSPLALGALSSRMTREGAIEGSDALTRAKLGGLALQRDQMAEAERMRLGAEQGLTDRQIDAAMGYGQYALNTYGRGADRRVGGETTLLGSRMGAESDIGGLKSRTGEYLTNQGMDYQRYAEAERARRAGDVAYNRQETSRYLPEQNYRRNLDIYGQRRGDEQEGREYARWQQQQQGGQYQRGADRDLQAWEATTGRQGGYTGLQIQNRGTAGPVERIGMQLVKQGGDTASKAFGFAEGGVVTEPTNALIGEGGEPEAVVPMSKVGPDEFARLAGMVGEPEPIAETSIYEEQVGCPAKPEVMYSDYRSQASRRPSL
jgi:hypothetical protein